MTHAGAPGRREAKRVAVLADVHGNPVALAEVLREAMDEQPDLIVFAGDLTWGPLPEETWAVVRHLHQADAPVSSVWIRGNADRRLIEIARQPSDGEQEALGPRDQWMLEAHSREIVAAVERFADSAVVEIETLGSVRFCHGSPRSDEELITSATPEARMRALSDGVEEQILVSAHTHLQFDRHVAGIRSVNPGSVGMPYEGKPGAYWALLGPDVELRCTRYDVDEAVRCCRASGDPLAEAIATTLLAPPSPEEVIAHAETLEFSA
jgi:putative phosphoesterase